MYSLLEDALKNNIDIIIVLWTKGTDKNKDKLSQ